MTAVGGQQSAVVFSRETDKVFERLDIEDRGELWPGVWVKAIRFRKAARNPIAKAILETRNAGGRAVIVDRAQNEIRLYPFYDLIKANFGGSLAGDVSPNPAVNLGVTVKNFVEGACRASGPGGKYQTDVKRCLYAGNVLHTNFVRANGFVIRDHNLIAKPAKDGAWGLDCQTFTPLAGAYTALLIDGQEPRVDQIQFKDGQPATKTLPRLAISGPALIQNGQNVSGQVPYRPRPGSQEPYDLDLNTPNHHHILRLPPGPTLGDEINYPPPATMTSLTAFGVREDGRLIFVSMFEDFRGQGSGCNLGLTIYEMAGLLERLEARHAILGGGGADTQQFLRGDYPQHLIAPTRARPPGQGSRAEVAGVRGLGVIVAVLAALPLQDFCNINGL